MFNMEADSTGEGEKSFNQVLRERRSIRAFKRDAEVDVNTLNKILEICDLAPSAGGLQTFEIYKIKNEEIKKQLVTAANDQAFISEAPLVLVFCADASRSVERFGERSKLFSVQDATIATAYAQLAVCALGLSAVWVGAFDEKKVSKILKLPEHHRPISMLPVGYANESPKEKTTRGSKNLLHVIN
jgi:nitroreductase